MSLTLISGLSTRNESWRIKVKVLRLWDSINLSTNEVISADMILADKKGNTIHASIGSRLINTFKSRFKENSIYILENFKVWEYEKYRPLKNNLKIVFISDTTVKEVLEESDNFTGYYFEFADSITLWSRKSNDTQCSDVIGLLRGIKPIQEITVAKHTPKERTENIREIEILLLDGEKIKVTLWGNNLANIVNEDLLGKKTIVIVTSNRVKDFYGLSLHTTNASKVYLDFEIPETKEIINKHCTMDVFPTWMQVDASTQGTEEQQMFYNRKTLRQIAELRYSDVKTNDYMCTTKARIDEIISHNSWWYMACISCYCGTKKESTNYICKSCNKIAESADERYIINIKISDETATTTCVIFNEVAQRLLGNKSVSTMLEQDGFSGTLPEAIRNLCGRTFIFRLKLTSRNLRECKEYYRVNYAFVPNDKLEMDYLNEKAEEDLLESQEHGNSTSFVMLDLGNQENIYSHIVTEETEGNKSDACRKISDDEETSRNDSEGLEKEKNNTITSDELEDNIHTCETPSANLDIDGSDGEHQNTCVNESPSNTNVVKGKKLKNEERRKDAICMKHSENPKKRGNNSNANNGDCIITNECSEELNEEIARTTKKNNIYQENKRNVLSKQENIVALNLSHDRPKRIRKTPNRFTY